MGKIVMRDGDSVRVIEQTRYATEQELQDFLINYPSLMPLDEAEANPLPLLPIGREVPVASGFIDVLYLDASGLLTIAETKLKRNPEARRDVIGQILEYAAGIATWSDQNLVAQAESFLSSEYAPGQYKGLTFEAAVNKLGAQAATEVERQIDVASLRAKIGDALRNGQVRLIVAVDEIHDSLKATITFLNTHSNFDIYLLQLIRFESGDGKEIFIPNLFGYASKVKPSSPIRRQWDLGTFLADLENLPKRETIDTVKALYAFADSEADAVWWGRGATEGSFTFHYIVNDQRLSLFTATTKGHIWVNFVWMKGRVSSADIKAFREDLNAIDGVHFSEHAENGNPGLSVSALAKPESLELFEDAVRKLGQAAKAAAEPEFK